MRTVIAATIFLLASQCAISRELTPQDKYDDSVGYARGYSLMAVVLGQRCMVLFPEYAEFIQIGLEEWKERNAPALAEIEVQWQAYVERDHKVAGLPADGYDKKLSDAASKEVAESFEILGGEGSVYARAHCRNYPSDTLRSPKLYLEARLMTELDGFRQCSQTGHCPNLAGTTR
jgi:hypothetical protein